MRASADAEDLLELEQLPLFAREVTAGPLLGIGQGREHDGPAAEPPLDDNVAWTTPGLSEAEELMCFSPYSASVPSARSARRDRDGAFQESCAGPAPADKETCDRKGLDGSCGKEERHRVAPKLRGRTTG